MPDGATAREHYETLERSGIEPAQLNVECPAGMWYLWEYFCRLELRRAESTQAITCLELESWARLNGLKLSVMEVDILDGLEALYLTHHRRKAAAK